MFGCSLKALLDTYLAPALKPAVAAAPLVDEEDDFLNTIAVAGGPIDYAFKYLKTNGKIANTVVRYYTKHLTNLFSSS